jgi:pikromycin synthase
LTPAPLLRISGPHTGPQTPYLQVRRRSDLVRLFGRSSPRIGEICQALIAGFRPRGRADLIHDFAAILPLTIICEMFGVPEADRAAFRRWTLIIGGIEERTVAEQPRAWAELGAYLSGLIRAKSRPGAAAVQTDLLAALIAVRDGGDRLSDTELLGMATVLLLAGHATTVNLIANAVLTLLRHPDQLAAIRADPSLIDDAVEETLRYEGPVTNPMLRYTRQQTRVGQITVPANEVVILSLAAADRDPDRFTEPDTFDMRRTGQAHLAFGHGVHYCIGAPLARLEARMAIPDLLADLPDLALDHTEELRWRVGLPGRALHSLPITFTPTLS